MCEKKIFQHLIFQFIIFWFLAKWVRKRSLTEPTQMANQPPKYSRRNVSPTSLNHWESISNATPKFSNTRTKTTASKKWMVLATDTMLNGLCKCRFISPKPTTRNNSKILLPQMSTTNSTSNLNTNWNLEPPHRPCRKNHCTKMTFTRN